LVSVVAAALVLLPAVLLLFRGPSYKKPHHRIIGAAMFALLAFAFLLPILGDALVLTGDGRTVYNFVATYRVWIVTGGIVLALGDIMTARYKHEGGE